MTFGQGLEPGKGGRPGPLAPVALRPGHWARGHGAHAAAKPRRRGRVDVESGLAIAGHPVSKPHKVGARWAPRATWTPGPTDAGETGGGETGPARRADRARQSAEQSKTARFFQNVFCKRRRGRHPACSTENPRTTTPSRLPRRTRLYQKTARRRLRTFTPTDSRTGIRPPCPLGYARPPVPPTRWHMHACVCVTCLYAVCHTRTRPYALPPRIANPCRACHRSMTRNVPSPRSSRSRSSRQTKAPARFAEPSNP